MKTLSAKCPACEHEIGDYVTVCPRCREPIPQEAVQARQAEDRKALVALASAMLLLGGLAALAGCWIYGNDRGMMGGGFLAVVGAVLSLRK